MRHRDDPFFWQHVFTWLLIVFGVTLLILAVYTGGKGQ